MPKAKKAAAAPMTKSDFIRKFPFNTPATEIVTKAKGVNLKLTPSFVYAIRAMDKKRKRVPGAPGKPGPKPAAATTAAAASAGGRVNKSAFVRNLPATLSAAEVIAKGKAAGVKLTAAQVYTVRANAKRSGLASAAPTAAAAPKAAAVKAPKAAAVKAPKAKAAAPKAAAPAGDHEQHFARLVINIGLTKAEQLLERVRDRVNSL